MTWTEYRKMRDKELIGRKVRALIELRNGLMAIPAGTILTITYKRSGFNLEADPCSHCGVRLFISKVEPTAVELLPKEDASCQT